MGGQEHKSAGCVGATWAARERHMKSIAIILVIAASIAAPIPALAFTVPPLQVESPVIPVKKGKGHGDHDEQFEHRRHHHHRHHSHRHHRYDRGWHHSGQHGGGGNRNQPDGQN